MKEEEEEKEGEKQEEEEEENPFSCRLLSTPGAPSRAIYIYI